MQEIKSWIESNNLSVDWITESHFKLQDKVYVCVSPVEGKIFDSEFNLILDNTELPEIDFHYFCFYFGGKVYYTPIEEDKVKLNKLKYVGSAKDIAGFPHLGIHGGYELCIGSKRYEDWCEKAKWLGIEALGLSEKHTLAGILKFQNACLKSKIKPILGETIQVSKGKEDFKLKLYVSNERGWENLLKIHKRINIDNSGQNVEYSFLIDHSEGLYAVIQNDTMLNDAIVSELFHAKFVGIYFQYDPVEYKSPQRDLHCLNCLKNCLNNYKEIPLALITDSYYLDKEDSRVKKILHFIGKGEFYYQSDDQHFKSLEEIIEQSITLFNSKGEEFAIEILESALNGTNQIVDGCTFKVKTGQIHLPKYPLSEKEIAAGFTDSEQLFWHVINEGLEKRVIQKGKDLDKYIARIESEYEIISLGNFQDYFLIVRDINNWCEENGIFVGTGRGSIGGSLIAYFCNVTKVDALEYNLIFERFLNRSRVGKGLPDADNDYESRYRDTILQYMKERFGEHNVSSIGTFGVLKTKAAFREILRFNGEEPANINYYSKIFEEKSDGDITSLFQEAGLNEKLKNYFNTHSNAINDIDLILNQPKNTSIHASGIIITPKEKQIYDWFPCKIIDGYIVSEWEGAPLDESGFLKADILGLSQLDKIHDIIDLIKEKTGEKINLQEIDLTDKSIYDLFSKGLTQDVFQFTTDGLTAYCRDVKPETIIELATITSLYRPGPMDSGAHHEYVKLKHGKKKPEYDWGTEELTKNTFGLYVFQEQAIFITQKVGGLTLEEGDGVRKATGKKDLEKMKSYKDKFVAGAIKNGCPEFEANKIWNKIEAFAGYSFNLSHAVAYSLIGYQTAWLKYYYPMQFWTISLQYANDDEITKRISEINKFEGIKLQPPDINKSRETFYTDWDTNSIYWSIGRIKQVGEVSLNAIIKERTENGFFFSLEEFCQRIKGKSVNSRVIKHLIFSGCFDELHNIKNPLERINLIREFCKLQRIELPEELESKEAWKEFFWYKLQRSISGYGFFDYSTIVDENDFNYRDYATADKIQLSDNLDKHVVVAGLLVEIKKVKTKKGEMAKLTIDNNNDLINVVLWADCWKNYETLVDGKDGNGIILNGKIQFDSFNNRNCIYSVDKTDVKIF